MIEISKELLSKILNDELSIVNADSILCKLKESMLIIKCEYLKTKLTHTFSYNIYELENKGKKWANNKGFRIIEIDTDLFWVIPGKYDISYTFDYGMISSTHNTFFKACQWILDNKA